MHCVPQTRRSMAGPFRQCHISDGGARIILRGSGLTILQLGFEIITRVHCGFRAWNGGSAYRVMQGQGLKRTSAAGALFAEVERRALPLTPALQAS